MLHFIYDVHFFFQSFTSCSIHLAVKFPVTPSVLIALFQCRKLFATILAIGHVRKSVNFVSHYSQRAPRLPCDPAEERYDHYFLS